MSPYRQSGSLFTLMCTYSELKRVIVMLALLHPTRPHTDAATPAISVLNYFWSKFNFFCFHYTQLYFVRRSLKCIHSIMYLNGIWKTHNGEKFILSRTYNFIIINKFYQSAFHLYLISILN